MWIDAFVDRCLGDVDRCGQMLVETDACGDRCLCGQMTMWADVSVDRCLAAGKIPRKDIYQGRTATKEGQLPRKDSYQGWPR